ncbi:MAG: bifunctional (p)ppGpp synthetase/guanosine-3',5'-bis(diphosphate) 3'-pyrophosphohydrolase [Eubacterium sp.]|nr:bifunctional (p)ppGpp synthetase/guanosine-3',5'-bis(diphosphate) 3'-pyrophosphohydrolase [Eubacterium sp.]
MTDVFEKAVSFAARAHRGQKRKDGSIYILHPLEVAVIAGTMTHDEDVIAAAVLHDTVEQIWNGSAAIGRTRLLWEMKPLPGRIIPMIRWNVFPSSRHTREPAAGRMR